MQQLIGAFVFVAFVSMIDSWHEGQPHVAEPKHVARWPKEVNRRHRRHRSRAKRKQQRESSKAEMETAKAREEARRREEFSAKITAIANGDY